MPELKIDDFPEIVTPQFTTELSIASLSFVEIYKGNRRKRTQ